MIPVPSRHNLKVSCHPDSGKWPHAHCVYVEVDRAIDNLVKSGKIYPNGPRRESMPTPLGGPGRPFDQGKLQYYLHQRFEF